MKMSAPLPYVGGKSRLASFLLTQFPKHTTYVEPFCGAARVFFHKQRGPSEILNDLDGELVNFLKICQLHHEELLRWLRYSAQSRGLHRWYKRQDPTLLTDVQRAARFLYLQRTSWGGVVARQNYQGQTGAQGRVSHTQLAEVLEATAKRLERTQIENWPYEKVLARYDGPATLFYLDPPYVGMPYYRFNFADADFERLAERLRLIKGKFILSINDHPTARQAFKPFHVCRVPVQYSLGRTPRARELLFSNFDLPCGSNI